MRNEWNPRDIYHLIFDCNHDNPSNVDRYQKQPSVALAHLALVNYSLIYFFRMVCQQMELLQHSAMIF